MSDAAVPGFDSDDAFQDEFDEYEASYDDIEEEIDPQEVESVIAILNELVAKTKSQTIKDYLTATCEDIAYLVEDLDDYEEGGENTEAA